MEGKPTVADTTKKASDPAVAETLNEAVAEHRASQEAEYGSYVANQPIDYDGVRAYNEGDPVPVSNVKRYNYEQLGWVTKV